MDSIQMHSDMYLKYVKGSVSVSLPPAVGLELDRTDGWGATPSLDNAWQMTLRGSVEDEGHAITAVGHDASACHEYQGDVTCARAEYDTDLDPTAVP